VVKQEKPPELTFQQHVADYLVREHKYGVLEQPEITDTEHCLAEDHLWAFLKATQADTIKKLTDDYSTDGVWAGSRISSVYPPIWVSDAEGKPVGVGCVPPFWPLARIRAPLTS